jgi:hypothetical protein
MFARHIKARSDRLSGHVMPGTQTSLRRLRKRFLRCLASTSCVVQAAKTLMAPELPQIAGYLMQVINEARAGASTREAAVMGCLHVGWDVNWYARGGPGEGRGAAASPGALMIRAGCLTS